MSINNCTKDFQDSPGLYSGIIGPGAEFERGVGRRGRCMKSAGGRSFKCNRRNDSDSESSKLVCDPVPVYDAAAKLSLPKSYTEETKK